MDENEQLERLDARARRAAEGLRAEAAARPVPPFDPDLHTLAAHPLPVDGPAGGRAVARRRRMAVVGLAAALALVAGVAALLSDGDESGSTPADRVESGSGPRRMVAGPLPEGFEVVAATHWDGRGGSDGAEVAPGAPLASAAWGPEDGWPTVGVAVYGEGFSWGEDVGLEEGAFGDRTGARLSGPDMWPNSVAVEVDGRDALVLGVSAEPELVERVAASLTFDGEEVDVPPGVLPGDWSRSEAGAHSVPGVAGSAPGWMALYAQRVGDGAGFLSVGSGAGDLSHARSLALVTNDIEEVPWRDGVAVVATVPSGDPVVGDQVTVAWSERPGELVTVGATGLPRREVLAVAEGVREADAATWEDLERQALLAQAAYEEGDEAVAVADGRFSDGSLWVLAARVQPGAPVQVDVPTTAGNGSHGASMAADLGPEDGGDAFVAVQLGRADRMRWAAGLVHEGVATVEVLDADGTSLGTAEVVEGGGHRGFVLELPPGEPWSAPSPLLPGASLPDLPVEVAEEPADHVTETTEVVAESWDPDDDPPPVGPAGDGEGRIVLVARDASGAELARAEMEH